jgi:effector-binding domain-containing protein
MKIFKIFGILIAAIIALIIILGIFAPGDYVAERKMTIDAPKELVFHHVQYWRNWQAWSPWAEQDPSMKITINGTDGEIGSGYSWVGDPEKTGKGEMKTTGITANSEHLYHLHFMEPYDNSADGWIRVKTVDGNKTEAAWGFQGEMPFPFNITLLFVNMEEMMTPDFDRGLTLLKEISEKEFNLIKGYNVEVVDYPATIFASIRRETELAKLQPFFAQSFGEITSAMGKNRARSKGMPCALYYQWDEQHGKTDVAAAIPVNRKFDAESVSIIEFPENKAYKVNYYGPYESLGAAHMALNVYFAQNGLEMAAPIIEQYATDPGEEPDPAKWLTVIYYFAE